MLMMCPLRGGTTLALLAAMGAGLCACADGEGGPGSEGPAITVSDPPSPDGCASADALAHGGCNWTCNDPTSPQLRVVSFRLETPASLGATFTGGQMDQAFGDGSIVWLLDVDPSGTFRSGGGTCTADDPWTCSFAADGVASGRLGRDDRPGHVSFPEVGDDPLDVTLRMESDVWGSFPIELDEVRLDGTLVASGNCVGTRLSESWEPGGDVSAKLRLSTARAATVDFYEGTLCDLVAGADPGESLCGDGADPSALPVPPDTEVDGEPAWTLEGTFAAIGVHIVPPP